MINGENIFGSTSKNNKVKYENIRIIATGKGDDYTTGCLLDYPYFKDSYKIIAVNSASEFLTSLDRVGNTRIFFIIEEAKETILDFSQETEKVL